MITNIFVNLPIKDLEKSKEFFMNLGFAFNAQFTDEKAACLIIGPNIYAMLVTDDFFKTFTKKKIVDASKSTETIIALAAGSREEVDAIAKKAVAAGGRINRDPEDHGWMYGQSFEDLDGHIWEVLWMDPSRIEK